MKKPPRRSRTAAPRNAFYAQSGGVTAVINASAAGVIETAARYRRHIGKVYAGRDGIVGALTEDLIDVGAESRATIRGLRHTPAGAFGSARFKLKGLEQNRTEYERLIEVFRAHDIGYFFYNGGNDSMDTALKVSQIGEALGYPVTCVGIPKTVDNDLPLTDCCPGFGSVAKYIAVSTREAALDVASMARTSTKVFVLEVMGRHAGLDRSGRRTGWRKAGRPAADHPVSGNRLRPGGIPCASKAERGNGWVLRHRRLRRDEISGREIPRRGRHARRLRSCAAWWRGSGDREPRKEQLGYKFHWAVADYLQRSARHIASKTDVNQAYAVGKAAVEYAVQGMNAVMPAIIRKSSKPYRWVIQPVPLDKVANVEKKVPRDFITADGFGITAACRRYLEPLIAGEDYPPYVKGLPSYVRITGQTP